MSAITYWPRMPQYDERNSDDERAWPLTKPSALRHAVFLTSGVMLGIALGAAMAYIISVALI